MSKFNDGCTLVVLRLVSELITFYTADLLYSDA